MALQIQELQHRALAKLPIAEQALLLAFYERSLLGGGLRFDADDLARGLYQRSFDLVDEIRADPAPYQEAAHQAIARQRDVAAKFGQVETRGYDEVINDSAVAVALAESAAPAYRQAALDVAVAEVERFRRDFDHLLERVPSERVREDVGALLADPRQAAAGYLLAALAADRPQEPLAIVEELLGGLGGDPLDHVAQIEQVERLIGLASYELKLELEKVEPVSDAPSLAPIE